MDRKEAIEIVQKNYPHVGFSGSEFETALRELIPELKESEDERIREAIEGAIRVYGKTQGEWIGGYDMDTLVVHLREAFGTLEKQKDLDKMIVVSPEVWDKAINDAYENGKKDGEKQKEQKPIKCIEFDNTFENEISHLIASVLNDEYEYNEAFVKYAAQSLLGYAKNEVKPDEWAKREKLFSKALQTANIQIGQLFEENHKLKEQKPTEWSKEDEKTIRDAYCWIAEYAGFLVSENKDKAEMLWKLSNKLKSLRPQPHWKPSDEQMEALRAAMEHKVCYCGCNHHALKSLYNDIQKLL